MRAFRPSRFALFDDDGDEQFDEDKQENVVRYRERAQAGLPLFELPTQVVELKALSASSVVRTDR